MSLANEPHFVISSAELADWVEQQGPDWWWEVDGEPLLISRVSFPCPTDELVEALRRMNRDLLVDDKHKRPTSMGQRIHASELDALTNVMGDVIPVRGTPRWGKDKVIAFCWKGSEEDWLLMQDSDAVEFARKELEESKTKE